MCDKSQKHRLASIPTDPRKGARCKALLPRRPPRRSAGDFFPRGSRASGAENAARRGPVDRLFRNRFPTSVNRTQRFTPGPSQSSCMIRRVPLRRRTPLRRRRLVRRAPMRRRRKTPHAPRLRRLSGVQHPQYRRQPLLPLPADWEERAERIRARDGYRCRNCGKTQQENGRKLTVDHILPRRWFTDPSGADDPDNLMSRCGSCHGKKTARAERKLLQGDVVGFQQHLNELGGPR